MSPEEEYVLLSKLKEVYATGDNQEAFQLTLGFLAKSRLEHRQCVNDYLKPAVSEIFDPRARELGFLRKGLIFYRLTPGKIEQLFGFYHEAGDPFFGVSYFIRAACNGQEYGLEEWDGENDISRLIGQRRAQPPWVICKQAEIVSLGVREALKKCEEILFPFLNTVTDYESYDAWEFQTAGRNMPPHEMNVHELDVSLALGNYDNAKKYIESRFQMNRKNIDVFMNILPYTFRDDAERDYLLSDDNWVKKMDKAFHCTYFRGLKSSIYNSFVDTQRYRPFLEDIESGHHSYTENYIRKREERSINSFVKYVCGKQGLEKYLETRQWPPIE